MFPVLFSFASALCQADSGYNYRLDPVKVSDDTYVVQGSTQNFSIKNGGNILNTAFVVTGEGVVVWDTGPSKRYGDQLKTAIAKLTNQPVVRVYISHHHPDHMLGNQAFSDDPVIYALPQTRQAMLAEGEDLTANLYRLVGDAMLGTSLALPMENALPGEFTVGGHTFVLHALKGHTAGDLMMEDTTTGTIFVGDLVFNQRAPTTPHADIESWQSTLKYIEALEFSTMITGHGPVDDGRAAIKQTSDYLTWLTQTLQTRAQEGVGMAEVLLEPRPDRFRSLAEGRNEFQRSVTHLFPGYEQTVFNNLKKRN
jgi:uncharacterized sulfatase